MGDSTAVGNNSDGRRDVDAESFCEPVDDVERVWMSGNGGSDSDASESRRGCDDEADDNGAGGNACNGARSNDGAAFTL